MEQYTLLVMTSDKVVHMKVFTSMKALLDYKKYYSQYLKNVELEQVDKYGYVWFAEVSDEEE